MRTTRIAIALLAASLALALAPFGPGEARAADCSPVPQAITVRCLDAPGLAQGAVGLTNVPGYGVVVTPTPGFACGPALLPPPGASVTVACAPTSAGATVCTAPLAAALVDDATGTVQVDAACAGTPGVSASCSTSPFPGNACFGWPAAPGAGTFDFTCTVTGTSTLALKDFFWFAECAQPVG